MWHKIKSWCWEGKGGTLTLNQMSELYDQGQKLGDNSPTFIIDLDIVEARLAIAHYCKICNIGFTTAHGCKNHKRIKHKV